MKSNVMQLISYVLSPYQMSSLRLHYLLLMLFFSPQCFFHQLFSWCITCSWFFKVRVERLFLKAVEKIVKIWKPTTFLSRYMNLHTNSTLSSGNMELSRIFFRSWDFVLLTFHGKGGKSILISSMFWNKKQQHKKSSLSLPLRASPTDFYHYSFENYANYLFYCFSMNINSRIHE